MTPGPGDREGRRAFFSAPDGEAPAGSTAATEGREGRMALFSGPRLERGARDAAPAGTERPHRRATVEVECRTCLARTRVGLGELVSSLVPSIWLPGRSWPRLMVCPSCHRLSWCRLHWRSAG